MPSPFPGIDPFIEGQLWADFHSRFIAALSEDLVPKVRPKYLALIEERVYVEREPEQPRVYIRPDVAVVSGARGGAAAIPPSAPAAEPVALSGEEKETYVELRLRGSNELVTIIELLSPGNKRPYSDGRREYLAKREVILRGTVHLVELDFLRGGERLPMAGRLPSAHGYAIVSRFLRRPMADVWSVTLRGPLPTIAIPLADGDPDVTVNLQSVCVTVYDRAGYDLALDYGKPVVPPLDAADAEWVGEVLGTPGGC